MESVRVCRSKNVLAELKSRKRKFLRPLAIESLILVRKVCATTYEALIVILKESKLILLKAELTLLLIISLYSLEKVVVKRNVH